MRNPARHIAPGQLALRRDQPRRIVKRQHAAAGSFRRRLQPDAAQLAVPRQFEARVHGGVALERVAYDALEHRRHIGQQGAFRHFVQPEDFAGRPVGQRDALFPVHTDHARAKFAQQRLHEPSAVFLIFPCTDQRILLTGKLLGHRVERAAERVHLIYGATYRHAHFEVAVPHGMRRRGEAANRTGNPARRFKTKAPCEQQHETHDLGISDHEDGLQATAVALGGVVFFEGRLGLAQGPCGVPVEHFHRVNVAIDRRGNPDQRRRDAAPFIECCGHGAAIGFLERRLRGRQQDGVLHARFGDEFHAVRAENGNRQKFADREFGAQAVKELGRRKGGHFRRAGAGKGLVDLLGEILHVHGGQAHVGLERRLEVVDIGPEDFGILLHQLVDAFADPAVEAARDERAHEHGDDQRGNQRRKAEQEHEPARQLAAAIIAVAPDRQVFAHDDHREHDQQDEVQPEEPGRGTCRRIIGRGAGYGYESRKHRDEGRDDEKALEEGPAGFGGS